MLETLFKMVRKVKGPLFGGGGFKTPLASMKLTFQKSEKLEPSSVSVRVVKTTTLCFFKCG